MISPHALAGFWLLTLAGVSVLYRTKKLPRIFIDNIDMVSLILAVTAATSTSMAAWKWFGPAPEEFLSWSMAAYWPFVFLSQIVGIRLTRIAMGLPVSFKADCDAQPAQRDRCGMHRVDHRPDPQPLTFISKPSDWPSPIRI